jgi:hypothetical protein
MGAFLQAVAGHLTAPGPGPEQDVRLACAAVTGHGLDLAAAAEFTGHLTAPPLPAGHGPNHVGNDGRVVAAFHPGDCITCHGHVTADGIFHPAEAS